MTVSIGPATGTLATAAFRRKIKLLLLVCSLPFERYGVIYKEGGFLPRSRNTGRPLFRTMGSHTTLFTWVAACWNLEKSDFRDETTYCYRCVAGCC